MWFRRRTRRERCPICSGRLSMIGKRRVCRSCSIEIEGSSLKPLKDLDWYSHLRVDQNR